MKQTHPWASQGRALLVAGLVGLASATHVWAHAFIDHTDPLVGSTVKQSPTSVNLWFTEGLEAGFSNVKVLDAAGQEVDKRDVQIDPKNPKHMTVSLPKSLGAETYKVVWHAVSVDTHVTDGSFTFTVKP
jgi:methionine-rich copper-binding protein CopC